MHGGLLSGLLGRLRGGLAGGLLCGLLARGRWALGERHFWSVGAADLCAGVANLCATYVVYKYDCGNEKLMIRDLENKYREILGSIYTISLFFDGIGD